MNVDYKIAPRSISPRLLKVLHFLVARCQTCGVPGHFIGEMLLIIVPRLERVKTRFSLSPTAVSFITTLMLVIAVSLSVSRVLQVTLP